MAATEGTHDPRAGGRPGGFLENLTKLIGAITALIGVLAASGLLLWLTGFPSEHFNSRSTWRVHGGWERDWRKVDFPDADWGYAVSPAPRGTNMIPVGEDRFPTMWIVPDTSEVTFRLTFQVSTLQFITDATLLSISDDDHDVFLNGLQIVSDESGSSGPLVTTDLRRVLREGKNVIAIRARDRGKAEESRWMAIDLRIRRGLPGS